MKAFARDVARVCDALGGYRPRELDIGGGFAGPRDPHNAATDYTAPIQYGALFAISKILQALGSKPRYKVLRSLIAGVAGHPNTTMAPSMI